MRTNDICIDKRIRPVDRAIDMGFGSKMNDGIYLLLLQKIDCQVIIFNVAMDKFIFRMVANWFQVCRITRISKCIKDNYPICRILFDPVMDKIGTDKSCSTGYKQSRHIKVPSVQ